MLQLPWGLTKANVSVDLISTVWSMSTLNLRKKYKGDYYWAVCVGGRLETWIKKIKKQRSHVVCFRFLATVVLLLNAETN